MTEKAQKGPNHIIRLGLLALVLLFFSSCFFAGSDSVSLSLYSPYASQYQTSTILSISGYLSFSGGTYDYYDVDEIDFALTYQSSSGQKTYNSYLSYIYSNSLSTSVTIPSDAISGSMTLKVTIVGYSSTFSDVSTSVTFDYSVSDWSPPYLSSITLMKGSSAATATAFGYGVQPSYYSNSAIYVKVSSATDNMGVTKFGYSSDGSSYTYVNLDTADISTSISNKVITIPSSFTSGLGAGTNKYLYLVATDAAGNNSSYQYSSFDLSNFTLPTLTITSPGSGSYLSSGSSVTVSGIATRGSTDAAITSIWTQIDAHQATTAGVTLIDSGTSKLWTITYSNLTEGSHTFKSTATDGTDSTDEQSITFIIDGTAPAKPTIGGVTALQKVTTSSLDLSISASDTGGSGMASVDIFVGTANVGSATLSATPNVYTYSLALTSNGNITIKARATDNAGNATDSDTVTFVKDALPVLSQSSPAPASTVYTTLSTYTVSGSASDNSKVNNLQYQVAGGAWTDYTITPSASINYSFSVTLPANASTPVKVRAVDDLGLTSTEASFTLVNDTTNPTVGATIGVTAANTSGSAYSGALTITGTASDNLGLAQVEFQAPGSSTWSTTSLSGTTSWTLSHTPSANGSLTYSFRAKDSAGNYSATVTKTLTYDVPPSIYSVTIPATTWVATASASFTAFASSTTPATVSAIEYRTTPPGSTTASTWMDMGTLSSVSATQYSATAGIPLIQGDGQYKVEFRAKDSVGFYSAANTSMDKLIGLDTSNPILSFTSPVANSVANFGGTSAVTSDLTTGSVTISGTAIASSGFTTLQIRWKSNAGSFGSWNNITAPAAGTSAWTYTASSIPIGTTVVEVQATSAVGKTAALSEGSSTSLSFKANGIYSLGLISYSSSSKTCNVAYANQPIIVSYYNSYSATQKVYWTEPGPNVTVSLYEGYNWDTKVIVPPYFSWDTYNSATTFVGKSSTYYWIVLTPTIASTGSLTVQITQ